MKQLVLSSRLKMSIEGDDLTCRGREFQTEGAATRKGPRSDAGFDMRLCQEPLSMRAQSTSRQVGFQ